MLEHLRTFALYNRWANARIYAAALGMPEEAYRRETGVFFRSLHGTLNHILAADRIWLKRLTGKGDAPTRVDAELYVDRAALAKARIAEDARVIAVVEGYDAAGLAASFSYATTSGVPQEGTVSSVLAHMFNHQTHHRGQAHACCSIVTGAEPPALDLMAFQRGLPAPDLAALL